MAPARPALKVWPTPPAPRLAALLTALRGANAAQKDVVPVLKKLVPKLEQDKELTLPSNARARILEIRSGTHLHGAFLLLCQKGVKLCDAGCDRAFSVKQAPSGGELVMMAVKAELFAGAKVRFAFSPDFPVTKALLAHFTLPRHHNCDNEGIVGNFASGAKRVHLFKVGRRRIILYKRFTSEWDAAQAGHSQAASTSISWHKGADGTWYLGLTHSETESMSDTDPNAPANTRTTGRSTSSVLIMKKNKYWKYVQGAALKRLRKTEPALKSLPPDRKR